MYSEAVPNNENSGIATCARNGREVIFRSDDTILSPIYGYFASEDKSLTSALMEKNNVPTPGSETVVTDADDEALKHILSKFKKVVVKPLNTNHGDGITIGIEKLGELKKAITFAQEAAPKNKYVLIQKQLEEAKEYRFLVLEGKVIAISHRRPPFVIGDGKKTTRQLIEVLNTDSRRGDGHKSVLTKVNLTDVVNAFGDEFLEVIPGKRQEVEVLKTSNLSKGGVAEDFTESASKGLKDIAVLAAKSCFLGLAGVDIMTKDIEKGDDKNSWVIEVNNAPGLRMHEYPSIGKPRKVVEKIWRTLENKSRPIGNDIMHLGRTEKVKILGRINIPAKIDTGADSSSIWASDVKVTRDGVLKFKLFGKGSKYYNGKVVKRTDYKVAVVRNANGYEQIRYRTHFSIQLAGRKIRALFNLSDRERNNFPILIGRRTILNKFYVDVAKQAKTYPKIADTKKLNKELHKNPYEFHQRYGKMLGRRKK
jgi:D-alanine-D-alanine ligase-like ATP-grasp enzyme